MTKLASLLLLLIIGVTSVTANDKEAVSEIRYKSWGEDNLARYLSPPTALPVSEFIEVEAVISAYNTVPEQTWGDPCLSASGDNICGRTDVVACPRTLKLGQEVEIDGKRYICLDRMNKRYENKIKPHFDISFDKDIAGAIKFGRQTKIIKIIK